MRTSFLVWICLVLTNPTFAQKDSSSVPRLTVSGFADLYYTYEFSDPVSKQLPGFLYSHALHNEISLNNALVQLRYQDDKVRGTVGLHTGTYVQLNYAAEPRLLQNVYEANAGFEVVKYLWFDVGIFTSHLGFESALSKDNWTLTRSLAAENSPYYEAGAKLTFAKSDKFSVSALVLNGWQRIKDNNSNKALGTQIQYKPNAKWLINSSTFYGNELPDSSFSRRFFHDLYVTFQPHAKWDLMALYDLGWQENKAEGNYDKWQSGVFLVRYKPLDKLRAAARAEFFQDRNTVVVSANKGFFTKGLSLNLDYLPTERIQFRVEGKTYFSDQPYFQGKNYTDNQTFVLTLSTSISL